MTRILELNIYPTGVCFPGKRSVLLVELDSLDAFENIALDVYRELFRLFRISQQRNIAEIDCGVDNMRQLTRLLNPTLSECAKLIARFVIFSAAETACNLVAHIATTERDTRNTTQIVFYTGNTSSPHNQSRVVYIDRLKPSDGLRSELNYIMRLYYLDGASKFILHLSETVGCTQSATIDDVATLLSASIFNVESAAVCAWWDSGQPNWTQIPPSELRNEPNHCCIL